VTKSPLYVRLQSTVHIVSAFSLTVQSELRWYNVPPTKQKSKKSKNAPQITEPDPSTSTPTNGASASADSAPLNFDTFVPTHDPSLNNGAELQPLVHEMPEGPLVGQDEAFQRALNAMYWGGYWTAVYHVRSLLPSCSFATRELTSVCFIVPICSGA